MIKKKTRLHTLERWPEFYDKYVEAFEGMLEKRREKGYRLEDGGRRDEVVVEVIGDKLDFFLKKFLGGVGTICSPPPPCDFPTGHIPKCPVPNILRANTTHTKRRLGNTHLDEWHIQRDAKTGVLP